MKLIGNFYLNSGLIITEESGMDKDYTKDLLEEEIEKELKESIKKLKDSFFSPAFKDGSKGNFEFGDTIFRLSDISAVKFSIEK